MTIKTEQRYAFWMRVIASHTPGYTLGIRVITAAFFPFIDSHSDPEYQFERLLLGTLLTKRPPAHEAYKAKSVHIWHKLSQYVF